MGLLDGLGDYIIYLIIIYAVILFISEGIKSLGFMGNNKKTIIINKNEKINITEPTLVLKKSFMHECSLIGRGVNRFLYLKGEHTPFIKIGRIKGVNIHNEISIIKVKKSIISLSFIILTDKDISFFSRGVKIQCDGLVTCKYKGILFTTEYGNETNDIKKCFDFLKSRYLLLLNNYALDGIGINMKSGYIQKLGDVTGAEMLTRAKEGEQIPISEVEKREVNK